MNRLLPPPPQRQMLPEGRYLEHGKHGKFSHNAGMLPTDQPAGVRETEDTAASMNRKAEKKLNIEPKFGQGDRLGQTQ